MVSIRNIKLRLWGSTFGGFFVGFGVVFLIIAWTTKDVFLTYGIDNSSLWIIGFTCVLLGVIIIIYSFIRMSDVFVDVGEAAQARIVFCRYCGMENKSDAVFCEKCGKKITE